MSDDRSAPVVSVVIPARNAAATLGEQLGALEGQHCSVPFEVIVVDNASTDATPQVVKQWQHRLATLRTVYCAEPGLDRARNAGVVAAHAEKVLICDADDVVAARWVAAMSEALDVYDIVAGRLDAHLLNDEFLRQTRDLPATDELPGPFWGLPYAVGANIGFRRTVFDRIDGFDPELQGAEEMDFCWRAQYDGCTIGFAPDAVVNYRLRAGLRDAARQQFVYGRGNAQLRAAHIRMGKLPAQTRRQQGSLIKKHLLGLVQLERVRGRVSRRRYLQDAAWFTGSLVGLAHYGVMV